MNVLIIYPYKSLIWCSPLVYLRRANYLIMEKSSPNFNWEQDIKISVKSEIIEPLDTKILNSIEVPDLTLRDNIRILKSKHIKIF